MYVFSLSKAQEKLMLHQSEWKVLLNKKTKKHTHTHKKNTGRTQKEQKKLSCVELCGVWYSKTSLLELHCIDEVILSTRFSDKEMIELLFGPHIHDNG